MPDPIQPCIMCAVLIAPDGATELAVTAYDPASGRQRMKVINCYSDPEAALTFLAEVVDQQRALRVPAKHYPLKQQSR
jgi:tRNA(Arg) A34 adenosine deaminase TadA